MARQLNKKEGYDGYLKQNAEIVVKPKDTKETSIVLFQPGTRTTRKLSPGSVVEYIAAINPIPSDHYEVYIKGERGAGTFQIHHKNITKPGREKFPDLKPQSLGVSGKYRTVEELAKRVYTGFKAIADRTNSPIGIETREYVICLLSLFCDHVSSGDVYSYSKTEAKNRIVQMWRTNWQKNVAINEIGKDFAEMLGPMWIAQTRYVPLKRELTEIYFPAQGNYPLVDYMMSFRAPSTLQKEGVRIYQRKYSAKSHLATSANTVKLSTVHDEIMSWKGEKKAEFISTWKKSWVFQLVEEAHRLISIKKKDSPISTIVDVNNALRNWCLAKKLTTSSETKAGFWASVSKDKDNQKALIAFFSDFIKTNIYYIIFDIDNSTGLPKFILDFNALSLVNVKLKELVEQVGFEPKFSEKTISTL